MESNSSKNRTQGAALRAYKYEKKWTYYISWGALYGFPPWKITILREFEITNHQSRQLAPWMKGNVKKIDFLLVSVPLTSERSEEMTPSWIREEQFYISAHSFTVLYSAFLAFCLRYAAVSAESKFCKNINNSPEGCNYSTIWPYRRCIWPTEVSQAGMRPGGIFLNNRNTRRNNSLYSSSIIRALEPFRVKSLEDVSMR